MKRFFLLAAILLPAIAVAAPVHDLTDITFKSNLVLAQAETPRAASVASVNGIDVLIVGPESVEVGDKVVLDASNCTADTFLWKMVGGDLKQWEVSDDGKKVYFWPKVAGKFPFLLALAKSAEAGKPPALAIGEHVVVVSGGIPAPTPKPVDPIPGPAPSPGPIPLPVGKFNLANFTRDLVLGNITSDKRGPASAFAGNFTTVATQLRDGTLKSLADANAKLKNMNNSAAGAALADTWKNGVIVQLNKKLADLSQAGTLVATDLKNVADAFDEISKGFAASGN